MFRTARRQGIRAPPYGGGRHIRIGIRIWHPRERTAEMVVHVHGAKRPNTGRWCRALSRTNLVLGIVSSRGSRFDEIGIDLYPSRRNHQVRNAPRSFPNGQEKGFGSEFLFTSPHGRVVAGRFFGALEGPGRWHRRWVRVLDHGYRIVVVPTSGGRIRFPR